MKKKMETTIMDYQPLSNVAISSVKVHVSSSHTESKTESFPGQRHVAISRLFRVASSIPVNNERIPPAAWYPRASGLGFGA